MEKLCRSIKGQVLVLFVCVLSVLLALTGLAVDVGMAYVAKSKLNAAVDAAAIAAGKVVSQGTTAMTTEATNFFNANYPSDLLGTTVSGVSLYPPPVHNVDGSWTITVNATASSPTYFAKVAGWQTFAINASATSTVRTLDLILVMDCSGSIGADLGALQAAAKNFVSRFDASSDRIGLIHFASGAVTDVTISATRGFNPDTLNSAIDKFTSTGATTSEEAMRLARAQLDNIQPPSSQSSLRAIVFFTDGAPNGVAGYFNGSSTPLDLYSETNLNQCTGRSKDCNPCLTDGFTGPCRLYSAGIQDNYLPPESVIATLPYTDWTGTVSLTSYNNIRAFNPTGIPLPNTWCNLNKAARNMLENVANAARSETNQIHIFTVGMGNALTTQEIGICGYGANESGANILQRLANVPGVDTYNQNQPAGVYVFASNATQLNAAFNQVVSAILRLSK